MPSIVLFPILQSNALTYVYRATLKMPSETARSQALEIWFATSTKSAIASHIENNDNLFNWFTSCSSKVYSLDKIVSYIGLQNIVCTQTSTGRQVFGNLLAVRKLKDSWFLLELFQLVSYLTRRKQHLTCLPSRKSICKLAILAMKF